MCETIPYTHEENLVSLHREIPFVLKDAREPEQASAIAGRALRENDDGTACPFPHLLQTLVFLLVVGGLGRNPPGVSYHGPERNHLEPEDLCLRSWPSGFGGKRGGI